MDKLSPDQIVRLLLAVAALLATGRILGELVRKFGQPSVLGEMLAGIVLGPTVLGAFAPDAMEFLFPMKGNVPVALDALTTVAISLFLLVAGMEVDLSMMFRQGRVAVCVGLGSMLVPFALGFGVFYAGPAMAGIDNERALVFAMFMATALSISALPVIAKTLLDLGMYRSDIGMLIVAVAIFNDLVGWIVFALVLSMMPGQQVHRFEVGETVLLTLGFALVMLTLGRWLIHKSLPFLQAHLSWPGGVLGFALSITLVGAAFTEWIGVHAIFGAFLVGVALGDSQHLRERTRTTIDQFVSFVFAPLFFASIGLRVNFVADFDWQLVLVVFALACAGKILGSGISAKLMGMPARQSWAVGFGLNARGAMEIILGLLALNAGLIDNRMFVALVVMALGTSMLAGPAMQWLLQLKKPRRFTAYVGARSFIAELKATDRFKAILELVPVSGAVGLDFNKISDAVFERERVIPTGLGNGIALPHARIKGLAAPQVAMGLSRQGIDFDSPDGELAHIILVILTPEEDQTTALALYRDILSTFKDKAFREKVMRVKSYTELLALMASSTGAHPGEATVISPAPAR